MGKDLPDLGPGQHDERATGGPPVDPHSGDRRTASSTTFKDMISTKSILFVFDFLRFSLIFLGLESLERV